jgi:hypothetical protein
MPDQVRHDSQKARNDSHYGHGDRNDKAGR